jgi:hypothetical protein
MFRSLGQVSGVGLSSAILQACLNKQLAQRFHSPEVSCRRDESAFEVFMKRFTQIIDKLRHASGAIADLPDEWSRQQARAAYQVALHQTFAFGLVVALVMFSVSLAVSRAVLISLEPANDLSLERQIPNKPLRESDIPLQAGAKLKSKDTDV